MANTDVIFQTLNEATGEVTHVRTLPRAAMLACPHFIMVPEHYRENGSCKCTDPNDPNMLAWGYVWDLARGEWVAEEEDEDEN